MSMLILAGGEFGAAVARRIAGRREATGCDLTAPFDQIAQLVEQHAFVAVATWRPYVQVCRALYDVCHRLRRRWSVVEISGSAMTCGPAIVPGTGAGCYHCFNARTDAPLVEVREDVGRFLLPARERVPHQAGVEVRLPHRGPLTLLEQIALGEHVGRDRRCRRHDQCTESEGERHPRTQTGRSTSPRAEGPDPTQPHG